MGSAIFRRISAQNLFQHLIISCCNAPTQRTKIPMLPGKYTEQYYSNAPPMDSTIFRRISTWNLVQHIIISCYEARTEGTKKPKLNGKCTVQDSSLTRPVIRNVFWWGSCALLALTHHVLLMGSSIFELRICASTFHDKIPS